jgi:hypothetical protein
MVIQVHVLSAFQVSESDRFSLDRNQLLLQCSRTSRHEYLIKRNLEFDSKRKEMKFITSSGKTGCIRVVVSELLIVRATMQMVMVTARPIKLFLSCMLQQRKTS